MEIREGDSLRTGEKHEKRNKVTENLSPEKFFQLSLIPPRELSNVTLITKNKTKSKLLGVLSLTMLFNGTVAPLILTFC